VRDLIAELGGLLPEDVDQLKVKGQYSLVKVDPSFEEDLIEALSGEQFEGKSLRIERATSMR
jgi:RNA recognition motif-containing protein